MLFGRALASKSLRVEFEAKTCLIIFKNPVRTTKKTLQRLPVQSSINLLMPFKETIFVSSENHTKPSPFIQNAELSIVEASGTYSYQWVSKV
jgi:hypothetical protein